MKKRKVLTILRKCLFSPIVNFLCGPVKRAKRVDKSCPSTVRAHFATNVQVYMYLYIYRHFIVRYQTIIRARNNR